MAEGFGVRCKMVHSLANDPVQSSPYITDHHRVPFAGSYALPVSPPAYATSFIGPAVPGLAVCEPAHDLRVFVYPGVCSEAAVSESLKYLLIFTRNLPIPALRDLVNQNRNRSYGV